MLKHAPDIVFYPLAIFWSLLYGAIAGFFYKLASVYENWVAINRLQMLLWKKYPQRSYQKYISNIWTHQIRDKPVELAEYTRKQIEKAHPGEPFPFIRLFINTIFMLFIAPFMAVSGLYSGPIYLFKRTLAERVNKHIMSR